MTTLTKETKTTPKITISNNSIFITGNSYPFEPELFWPVAIHELNKISDSVIQVELNHINTNSIFYLSTLFNSDKVSEIVWIYEDDEDKEVACDIKSLCGDKMKILQKDLLAG